MLRTQCHRMIAFGVMTEVPKGESSASWLVTGAAPAPAASRPGGSTWVPDELRKEEPAAVPEGETAQDSWVAGDVPAVTTARPVRPRTRGRRRVGRAHVLGLLLVAAVGAFGAWAVLDDTGDRGTARAPVAAGPSTSTREDEAARRARDAARLSAADAAAHEAARVARQSSARRARASRRTAPSGVSAAAAPTVRRSAPTVQAQPRAPSPRRTVTRRSSPTPSPTPSQPSTPATSDPAGTSPSSQPGRGGTER